MILLEMEMLLLLLRISIGSSSFAIARRIDELEPRIVNRLEPRIIDHLELHDDDGWKIDPSAMKTRHCNAPFVIPHENRERR